MYLPRHLPVGQGSTLGCDPAGALVPTEGADLTLQKNIKKINFPRDIDLRK